MRSQILASVSLLAVGAYSQACMSSADAAKVAGNFQALIAQPFSVALADATFTPDFVDWASGVNTLIDFGCTSPIGLTDPTFTSRAAFIAGQSGQKPIPFNILNIWNNCDTVMLRWRGDNLGPTQPGEDVTGMIVLETVPNPSSSDQPWQIQTAYSEFNSGAWLYDLGVFVPNCTAS